MGNESGKIGENIATDFLKKNGYSILDRNFKIFEGEIDIIAYDNVNDELAFVEVKTRKNILYGTPSEFVNKSKIEKIKKAAFAYLSKKPYSNYRIDIISILYENRKYDIEHIKNITL